MVPSDDPTFEAWQRAPVSMFFGTVGGVGHLPGGPGTFAAALATPAIVAMSSWPLAWRLALFVALTIPSIVWCHRAGLALDEHDSRRIVLDEVIGVWATLVWFDELGWPAAVVGFVAFRILDVVKPPGARGFEEEGEDGWAVVADDIVAGLWAAALVWGLRLLV